MTTPKSAMIFAAGFGTRMQELAKDVPKPMVPFDGRPMIDQSIDLVRSAGIETIVANTHHLHARIGPHLTSKGVIVRNESPRILDTGGGLRAALPHLGPGPVLTINPDAAWIGPNPVIELIETWRSDMQALLLLVPLSRAYAADKAGDFSLEHGELRRNGPFRYTGAQLIRTDLLGEIKEEVFSLNAYWDLLAKRHCLNGCVYKGEWCDIGHPEGLKTAEALLSGV